MTVKELIDRLAMLPQDAEALVLDDGAWQPIADVAFVGLGVGVVIGAEPVL